MAEIINLRLARKARKREASTAQAARNRAKFGQSAAARAAQQQDQRRTDAVLDGARLDRD